MKDARYLEHERLFREDTLAARQDKKILLCGAGALGSFLTELLVRQGYNGLTVLDRERVEGENFGTQNYGNADVGRPKATQLASNIFRKVGVKVTALHKELKEGNARMLLGGFDLVVDLFDNAISRRLIQATCQQSGVPCLHAGLATIGYAEVRWNERYAAPPVKEQEEDGPCEYPMAANLVMFCVSATAEVINQFVDEGKKKDVEFWLKSMSVQLIE